MQLVVGRLLLLFILLPLVELYLLVWFADRTSPNWMLLLVLSTGFLGWWLTRSQGLRTYRRIQDELREGQVPTNALLDGLMIFVAGAFLLTPGLISDLVGFSLVIPWTRSWYRNVVLRWVKTRVSWKNTSGHPFRATGFYHGAGAEGDVVDAEVRSVRVEPELLESTDPEHEVDRPGDE